MSASRAVWSCLSLFLISSSAFAQSTDTPLFERSLATFKKEPGIDESIWKPLGGAGISNAKDKLAKLPRRWEFGLRTVPSANPEKVSVSRVEVRTKPLDEGFVLVETKVEGESGTSATSDLSWLGLVSVQSQTNSRTQVSGTLTGSTPIEMVITRKLEKLRSLELQLDQMKAGYRWSQDYALAAESTSKSTLVSRQNKTTITTTQNCEVTQGGPAASLWSTLTGAFLNVVCRSAADAGSQRELLYLEDYAFFIPKRTKTKPFDAEYRLTDVTAQ